ncbi:response regulator [Lichenihabitans psoromatis]|uniref:response regulator n=1 Tax=Lichenihabitans psoromatis TaxID=2528642 RepID=UPI001A93FABE|nr:response regulator [Lichenihabitans psoromatis]
MSEPERAANRDLRGLKVFIVEDESLIAMLLEDLLGEIECDIVGSALTFRQAMEQAPTIAADVAILDINLGGDAIFPVAEILAARGMSIIFASGYGATTLPEAWRNRPTLPKPFSADQVADVLQKAIGASAG